MSEVELVAASMSSKGTCQQCGQSREVGSHKKCDLSTFRRPYIRYTANTTETTAKKLKDLAATFPDEACMSFRVEIAHRIRPVKL